MPQGNVLGSILYALFTVGLSAAPGTKIYTFADDTAILSTQKSIRKAIKSLQNHLNEIGKWTENNKIKIKTIKCVHITFTLNKGPISKIKFTKNYLKHSPSNRNYSVKLGLHLDNKLNWKKHIQEKI